MSTESGAVIREARRRSGLSQTELARRAHVSQIAGNADGGIRRYYADTGQPAAEPITTGGGTVWALTLDKINNRTIIIAGNDDGGIRRYYADTGQPAGSVVLPGYVMRVVVVVGLDVIVSLNGPLARLTLPSG